MNILYIEDEPITRAQVKKMLERKHHIVFEASNGVSGLKKFLETNPDIIIADMAMPGMSGDQMISKIRHHNPVVPIIVTTAYADEFVEYSNLFNFIIKKPFFEADIFNAIEFSLSSQRQIMH